MPAEPRYYFSFRSPYSWLAHRELTTHHPDVAARCRWVPFWEPDAALTADLLAAGGRVSYTPMSRAKHLYILQDVRRLCRARQLAVRWPVDRRPRWEVPHLAYLAAAAHGQGLSFVDGVFEARWLRGEDICASTTLRPIAERAGLDADEVCAAADDPRLRSAGVQELLRIERDGVFGVPFFTYGFDRFWGLDRVADFVAALALPPAPADALAELAGRDGRPSARQLDHAGGCG